MRRGASWKVIEGFENEKEGRTYGSVGELNLPLLDASGLLRREEALNLTNDSRVTGDAAEKVILGECGHRG